MDRLWSKVELLWMPVENPLPPWGGRRCQCIFYASPVPCIYQAASEQQQGVSPHPNDGRAMPEAEFGKLTLLLLLLVGMAHLLGHL
ncbi:MAG TPA: hypothetical protein VG892_05800, partial [Terriglobales bacterium]|nr:hypothetical protein [Terriglobales bacterium]